ncbi:MAG: hypothetical protein IJX91_01900 [Clostridia bacterium]|nr:hypothetical protein [Clostridia bacterium]
MKYANALLISSAFGILWLSLIFALCFFFVHLVRLAKFGQTWRKEQTAKSENAEKKDPPPAPPEKKAPPKETGEPIYYIVERKRRTKSSFGEPKQIKFK